MTKSIIPAASEYDCAHEGQRNPVFYNSAIISNINKNVNVFLSAAQLGDLEYRQEHAYDHYPDNQSHEYEHDRLKHRRYAA